MRFRCLIHCFLLVLVPPGVLAQDVTTTSETDASAAPVLESLLSADLEGNPDTAVIVSRVSLPPNTTLPKHWHPGEEFAVVIKGAVTLWQKDKEPVKVLAGEAIKVPIKQIHTAITEDEAVELIVFRVHEKGQPERILVDNQD